MQEIVTSQIYGGLDHTYIVSRMPKKRTGSMQHIELGLFVAVTNYPIQLVNAAKA